MLTGPRQTGKTTVLQAGLPEYRYVTLDVPEVAQQAEESGREFLRRHPPPVIIDEVQYAPGLFRYLKAAIDENRQANGQFILTGSQHFPLFESASESLAGRIAILQLHSLSAAELEEGTGRAAEGAQLLEWIHAGGYPELHARGLAPERFYADYVATYLERDVRQLIQVRNLRDFDRFLRMAAARTGQLLHVGSLAADLGLAQNTVRSWLAVLERSGIVRYLEPFYRNFNKRMVKTPKLYFLDTGLVCYLTGLRTPEILRESSMLGAIFETYVFGQLVRSYTDRGETADIYFWRDHGGREADFVVPRGEKMELYEVKWAERVPETIAAFEALDKIAGPENIHSRTLITPVRGPRHFEGRRLWVRDPVEPRTIEAASGA